MARKVFVIDVDDNKAAYIHLLADTHVVSTVELDSRTQADLDEYGQVVGVEVLGPLREWLPDRVGVGLVGPVADALRAIAAAWGVHTTASSSGAVAAA